MSQQVSKQIEDLVTDEWTVYSKRGALQVNVECQDEEGPSWEVFLMEDGVMVASMQVSYLSASKMRTLIANWTGLLIN